jgi:hypothetical protein
MNNTYEITVDTSIVSYRDDDGEWMDGDHKEITSDTQTLVMDDDDFVDHSTGDNRANVAWAIYVIDVTTDAIHPSSGPIGDRVHEHEWLSGSYEDPYQGDSKVTETSVRLTGDWTEQDRALVFKAITGKYHTA